MVDGYHHRHTGTAWIKSQTRPLTCQRNSRNLLRVPAPRLQSGHHFKAEESGGLFAAAALHGASGGVGHVEDHGLAFGVGGTVDGLVGDFAFRSLRQSEVCLHCFNERGFLDAYRSSLLAFGLAELNGVVGLGGGRGYGDLLGLVVNQHLDVRRESEHFSGGFVETNGGIGDGQNGLAHRLDQLNLFESLKQ